MSKGPWRNHSYEGIDEEIVGAVASGVGRYTGIWSRLNLPPRVVDRRLQALRRTGRLMFNHKDGWKVPAPTAAEEPSSKGEGNV